MTLGQHVKRKASVIVGYPIGPVWTLGIKAHKGDMNIWKNLIVVMFKCKCTLYRKNNCQVYDQHSKMPGHRTKYQ